MTPELITAFILFIGFCSIEILGWIRVLFYKEKEGEK